MPIQRRGVVDHERRQLVIGRSTLRLPLIEKDMRVHATRKIGLDVRTLEFLRELREKQEARAARFGATVKDDGFVFSHAIDASQPWRSDEQRWPSGGSPRSSTCPDSLHDLRQFGATPTLTGGQDVRTVSGRLGHANAGMTLSIYAQFVDAADHEAAEFRGG